MYSTQIILLLTAFLLTINKAGTSPCIVTIDGPDWPAKPAILTNHKGETSLPSGDEEERVLVFGLNEQFELSCPGTYLTIGPRNVWIECVEDSTFMWWEKDSPEIVDLANFAELGCKRTPSDEAQIIGTCGQNEEFDLIHIGFDVASDDMIEMVEVCHDIAAARTLWSRHVLLDEIKFQDKNNERPKWDGDFFNFDADHAYSMDTQWETFSTLLGSPLLADFFLPGGEYYLARGHLAPNADYIFYSWMDSTFYLINAAPQWQCFNARNWAYLEESIRDFTILHSMDYIIYTGTYGVMELPDINNNPTRIFLYEDKLPVPNFYWKIVYSPSENKGIAAVGVNNPYIVENLDDFIICPPIESHALLDRIPDAGDVTKGLLYLCKVGDLTKIIEYIPDLPALDLLE